MLLDLRPEVTSFRNNLLGFIDLNFGFLFANLSDPFFTIFSLLIGIFCLSLLFSQ